jgi:hypothetical protein
MEEMNWRPSLTYEFGASVSPFGEPSLGSEVTICITIVCNHDAMYTQHQSSLISLENDSHSQDQSQGT